MNRSGWRPHAPPLWHLSPHPQRFAAVADFPYTWMLMVADGIGDEPGSTRIEFRAGRFRTSRSAARIGSAAASREEAA